MIVLILVEEGRRRRFRECNSEFKIALAPSFQPKSSNCQFSPNRRSEMSILRRSLSAPLSNGHTSFILPCKKLIFEYCEVWGSNRGMKDFLAQQVTRVAAANPGVECVVRRRPNKHPVLRAVYGQFLPFLPFSRSLLCWE